MNGTGKQTKMVKGETNKQVVIEALKERERHFISKNIENLKEGEKKFEKIGNWILGIGAIFFVCLGAFLSLFNFVLIGALLDVNLVWTFKLGSLLLFGWIGAFTWFFAISWIMEEMRKKKERLLK